MNAIKEVTVGNKILRIFQDDNGDDPRGWDNLSKMVCFHRNYKLGDKHEYQQSDYRSWTEIEQAIKRKEEIAIIQPLFLYDHSGITISTSDEYPYNDRWDAGQVGFIYITKKDIREAYGVKRITKALIEKAKLVLLDEVKVYDQYLTGDVYRFTIDEITTCDKGHEHENQLDSCGGFYGTDFKHSGMLDYVPEELVKALENS